MVSHWPFLLLLLLSIDAVPVKTPPPPSTPPPATDRILESDLVGLPDCQRNCAHDLAETYGALLKMGGSHVDRFQTVCQKYVSTRECVSLCPDPINLFETLTSGIAYMCHEQGQAFNATIECVDASSADVQRECDQTCNTQAVMFKWFMESMHRMSEHGASAGMGGAHGGGGLLDLFSGLGGAMRAQDHPEEHETTSDSDAPSDDLVLPSSVGRVRRGAAESRGLFSSQSDSLSFLGGADKSIASTGSQANAVLDTVQRSITAFTQPKNSPLFPSSNVPSGKSVGHSPLSSAINGLGGGGHGAGGNPIDLSTMRDFTSDACQVSECFLSCVKSKMNARCDGSAGSLLSEVFMRPLARAQENLSAVPMAGSLFGFLLPPQCRFLYDSNRMADYRMDSSLDEDLKRTYREKQEEQQKLDSESIMPTVIAAPLSPFDSNENLDDLIANMYRGEGETEKSPVDTVIYKGPIRKTDRSLMEYDIEGSGEGSGSGVEMEEGSGEAGSGEENETFAFEFQAPHDGEIQCVRV